MRPRPLWAACLAVAALLCLAAGAAAPARAETAPIHFLPAPPDKMSLCGEPVPLQVPFVAEELDREFTISVHDVAQVVMWLKRANRYFPYITAKLAEAGLPNDLKYLAVAESALLHRISSPSGAVGLWQFIPETARRYGLRVNHWFDDRRNVELATPAALAYLKDLREEFGSWALAMAAYNCGERRVRAAVEEQGVRNYYFLALPRETQRYVFRILAAKIILSDPARYGYVLPPDRCYTPRRSDRLELKLARPLHLRYLARATHSTVRQLLELNPQLRTYQLPAGLLRLRVPEGQAKDLGRRLAREMPPPPAPRAPSRGGTYRVRSGDTLSHIAKRYGIKVDRLRRANGLPKGGVIKPGQSLRIPQ